MINGMKQPDAYLFEDTGGNKELVFDCYGEQGTRLMEAGWTCTALYAGD